MARTHRKSAFYRNLLCVAAVVLALIAIGLTVLWFWLADYQQAQPSNWGKLIQTAYENADAAVIAQYCTNLPAPLKNTDKLVAYLKENISGKSLYFYPGTAKNKDEIVYDFQLGEQRFAKLTLKLTSEKSRFGFDGYEIAGLEALPLSTYTLTVPSGIQVLLDGTPPEEQTLQSTQDITAFVEIGRSYTQNVYELSDLNSSGTITATAADGGACEILRNEETGNITVRRVPEEARAQELRAAAQEAAQRYIVFATARGAARGNVTQLLYPDTSLMKAVLAYNNDWGEVYISDRYENLVVDAVTAYSDTDYSCHVSLTYIIRNAENEEKSYDFNSILYLTLQNGFWQWVAMEAA